jgi:transposase-like protein
MPEFDRLNGCIEWIDLSFVERQRTPEWAIQVGIRCHLAGMSTRDASQFLDELGVRRSHVAIHNWVHKADLQPVSTMSADQLAVDEKVIRIDGNDYWLYGAVGPETNEILQFRLFPTTTKRTTDGSSSSSIDDIELITSNSSSMMPITW